MREDVLTIRAHHLVCLAHHAVFGGEHPTLPMLLEAIREDPDRSVRVVAGPDDICNPCPHWDGTRCLRSPGMEEKNRTKDGKLLTVLGLADGEVRTVREIYDLARTLVTVDILKAICPTCSPEACARAIGEIGFPSRRDGDEVTRRAPCAQRGRPSRVIGTAFPLFLRCGCRASWGENTPKVLALCDKQVVFFQHHRKFPKLFTHKGLWALGRRRRPPRVENIKQTPRVTMDAEIFL